MPTTLSQLVQVTDAVVAALEAIDSPWDVNALFDAVYRQGDTVDDQQDAVAIIALEPERVDETVGTNTKTTAQLPIRVQVRFYSSINPNASEAVHVTHAAILAEVQKALMAEPRTLSGTAIDVRYLGRGTFLAPAPGAEEPNPVHLAFEAAFEITYRFRSSDPYTGA